MIKEELSYANDLRDLANQLKHPILKVLFLGVALDSEKHSKLYEAILSILIKEYPLISQEKLDLIKERIKKHIEIEERMIELTKKLTEKTKDLRLKLILSAIHDNEVKHHSLLQNIEKNIAEAETLTKEALWDMIWKDSLWHGASGG